MIDGRGIGQQGHVAVIIVGKTNECGIRAVDFGYSAYRIVIVACGIILRTGYGFKESLSIIDKGGFSGIGADGGQPPSGIIPIRCIKKAGYAHTFCH